MSDPVDANLAEARRWLKQAGEHLSVAQWDRDGKFWAAACFQAQQAAETAVKAVLIREGERSIITHGVVGLVKRVANYHPDFADLAAHARRLDRYYIPTRYPNGLVDGTAAENFDRRDAEEAIQAVDEIIQRVRRIVEGS